MRWRFFIDGVQIIEPVGWDGLKVKLERSENHGINFVYSANELGFTCATRGSLTGGYSILKNAYESDLYLTTFPILRVEYSCNGNPWTLFSEFNLNLSGYKENISESQIFVTVEQTGGRQQFANNYELPINYFAEKDVNDAPYSRPSQALQTVHLPPLSYWTQNLLSYYTDDSYIITSSLGWSALQPYVPGFFNGQVRFNNQLVDEPDDFAYTPYSWVTVGPGSGSVIVTGKLNCTLRPTTWYGGTPFPGVLYRIQVELQIDGVAYGNVIVFTGADVLNGITTYPVSFDFSVEVPSVSYGGAYPFGYIQLMVGADAKVDVLGTDYRADVTFECVFNNDNTENFLEVLEQNQIDTPSGVDLPGIMINEAFSVITDLISAQSIQMDSKILGRTDSYPINQASNGAYCNVAILSGLMVRRFQQKSENVGFDPFTYSFKQLFEGCKAFFPIGWGFLGETLKIEAVPYFYQDDIAITINAGIKAGGIQIELDKARVFNRVKIGNDDWSIDGYNALDETNTINSYASGWQSVNQALDFTGDIYTQSSRIVDQRLKDYRTNPGDADESNDIYALWIDFATVTDPTKEVLQGIVSGAKIKDITSVINWSFNASDSMQRHINTHLQNFCNWQGGEGNTEASGTAQTVGQTVAVTYPDSTIYYPTPYTEPINPTDINGNVGSGTYRKFQTVKVKGYITASDFAEILVNPYKRVQVNSGSETFIGWIESIDFTPNDGECELSLIYF